MMLWRIARLAAAEQCGSGQVARQKTEVWNGEGAKWKVPDVALGKSPFLPPQTEPGREQHPTGDAGEHGTERGM